jgi:23S rRNA pseudouridine2605 synthase
MSDETNAEASQVRAGQRIAKVMARAGICSRRDAEAWIAAGRVSVNGETLLSPAFNVSDADDVRVDGQRLGAAERTRLFLFHKPRGFVTTARDPEGRPTVFDALPPGLPRLVAVGRLDINTEGLMLLTNDGGLARVLELPSTGWLRRYRVRAHGNIDQAALDALGGGIAIDGVDYLGIEAKLDREQGSNVWITLGLREGKNREIKKVLEHLGLAVNRLIRVSFGPFELGDLVEGEAAEVRTRVLRDQLGAKLAKEAQADFDAPLIARDAPTPAAPSADERSSRRASVGREHSDGSRPDRDGQRGRGEERERRFDHDRPPPARSTPERRRKHVSRLRAEIAADAAATRKRIERSATHDRKGRTIAVERISPTREEARRRADAEARPPHGAGRGAGKRGRKEGERPPRSDRADGGRRAEFEPRTERAERREGPPRERNSDRPRGGKHDRGGESRPPRADAKDRGPRPEFKSRGTRAQARDGATPARRFDRPPDRHKGERESDRPRERARDRPQGRKHDRGGESRPPRADANDRGPRPEFKSRGTRAQARDGAPPARRFDRPPDRHKGERESDRPRERAFDRPQGQKHDRGGESRPPRADANDRGPRPEFKSRGTRAQARDGAQSERRFDRPPDRRRGERESDRPRGHGRETGGGGGAPRARSSPGRPHGPPGKGPPGGRGKPPRPPRKP